MVERVGSFEIEALLREAGWIRSLARGLADWPEDARELEQEAWLAALRARPATVVSTSQSLRPWLATVMRNAARALARGEAHRRAREHAGARPEALPSAEELVARADLQRALVAHVLALEEPYRSTVLLCFYEGLAPSEIAARQGIAPGTVRSRLSRGVAELRRRLDARSGGDRSRWLAVLAPLPSANAAPVAAPLILMKKLAFAAALLAMLGGWTWWELREPRAAAGGTGAVSSGATFEATAGAELAALPAAPTARAAEPQPATVGARVRRVRLVDEHTDESVPGFALALLGAAGGAQLSTDDRGEFECALDPGGEARFDLVENLGGNDLVQTNRGPEPPVRVALAVPTESGADALELRIPVGPTYRLVLQPPAGHEFAALEASLRSADPRQAFDVARAKLRAPSATRGSDPWVRFRPAANFVSGGPPWRLEVQTPDGLWVASAEVSERRGIAREPVVLTFEPRARVHGCLRAEDGAPLAKQSVRLERAGASFDDLANRPLVRATDAAGRFDFRALPAGEWSASVEADGFESLHVELALAALESRELDWTARRAPEAARAKLEGLVESSTGRYDDAVYVSLFPVGTHAGQGARVEWSDAGGRRVGRFAVEDLKPGRYRVSARVPGLLAVEPATVETDAGGEPVRFVVRDDVATAAWHVRAFAGGQELTQFRLSLSAGGLTTAASASEGRAVIENLPLGTRCEYEVRSEGFAPRWGEVVIDGATTAEQPARFDLQPGWGTAVTVVDREGRPLAGARVSFDGEFAATTDEAGRARVALPREPQTVRIELPGWKLAAGNSVAADTGRFRTWEPFLHVGMEPAQ